ncbi:MAG TPA: ATP-binding protein [Mycobacteriales bacterium]|nr:ATP-binding protein [Mycobacteriales bacterium]
MDCGTGTVATSAVMLPPEVASTPRARVFVRTALTGVLPADVVSNAELCVSELVTNAVLHAGTPVRVHVGPVPGGIRIQVQDASGAMPLRVRHSRTAATGRGLALVAAIARSWGVDVRPEGGKTVWCELVAAPAQPTDEEALLAAWDDDVEWDDLDVRRVQAADQAGGTRAGGGGTVAGSVVYHRYPVALSMRLQEHYEALTRECQLLRAAAQRGQPGTPLRVEIPHRLAQLAEEMAGRYVETRSDPERRRLEAFARGDEATSLTYPIVPELKEQIVVIRDVLAEMDEYSQRNALLTLSTPPDIHALTAWLLEEYLRQADGHPPRPWDGPLR